MEINGETRKNFSGARYFNGDEKLDLTSCVAGLIREREGRGEKKCSQGKRGFSHRGHPTNFFYKLANQDTRIRLTVTPSCKVQQASDATTNY